MTTPAAPSPSARVPTPRPKTSRATSLVSESAPATKSRPNQQPHAPNEGAAQSQQPGPARRGSRLASADPLSDKATAFLVRRVLCPQQADKGKSPPDSIEELLPPLTSRNDVDLQLYGLIAIIVREFVQSWYAKITTDETFVAEIVQIIAHITRALEQRVRRIDLESLLFDELPDLLDKHVTAYRIAHDPMVQAPVAANPREIYHSLCPLPALSPVPRPEDPKSVSAQAENEAAYRQLLVDGFLALLLPTEDLQNGCLTALLGQILSELILGNAVANRLSQPWLIWELLILAARAAGAGKGAEQQMRSRRRSSTFSDVRTRLRHTAHAVFYTSLQWCLLAVSFIRTVLTILMTSGSLPSRVSRNESGRGAAQRRSAHEAGDPASPTDPRSPKTPVLAFRCWSALSNLAEVDSRMPWLRGAISLLQWIAVMGPGRVAGFDTSLDRFLSYSIQRHILTAANLPPLLRAVRGALFPNNMPAGNPALVPPSSDVELRVIRRRCASALWALVPKGVGRLYFGGGLLRANPVLRRSRAKTEGSADLKTAVVGKPDSNGKEADRGNGRPSSSLSSEEDVAKEEKASAVETVAAQTAQAGGPQKRPRSRSQPRSRRSAPVPTPKTGGQGPTTASADPPRPSPSLPPSKTASAHGEARTSMASPDKEKMSHQDDHVHHDNDDDDDDDNHDHDSDGNDNGNDEEILLEIEQCILDVFSDAYCNKHLLYGMLELILVRLLPELTEKETLELLKERISLYETVP
ncbi:hypothetical protein VTH06DRAFT_3713 [Thermothelomyces fergusii]